MAGMEHHAGMSAEQHKANMAEVTFSGIVDRFDPIVQGDIVYNPVYDPKTERTAVLAGALQIVIAGDCYVPPSLMQVQGSAGNPLAALAPRQRDVLRQLIDGKANKEIARCLGMSEPTVKAHLVNIFRVLGVRNRAQAVLAGSRLLG